MSRVQMRTRSAAEPQQRMFTTSFEGVESQTRQDHAIHVNINEIYKRTQHGQMPIANAKAPEFGDFSNVETYDQALNKVMAAQAAFMELPADERRKYGDSAERYYTETLQNAQEELEATNAALATAQAEQEQQQALEAAQKLVAKHSPE